MRAPVTAIAWEFWGANRLGWLLVLAGIAACALLFRALHEPMHQSEDARFVCYLPLVASIILAISFCNFTDRNRRDGIAGFPRHLFALPASTALMVTCVMVFSVLSVVGLYIAWTTLVLQPLDTTILIRWPATLLAAFVVFYQAIIWCLCGFRLTRVIALSLVATMLVAIGFLPTLLPHNDFWASETNLSAVLTGLMGLAYIATLVTVGVQRRGGARGWTAIQSLAELAAATIPRPQFAPQSREGALYWMEWRRTGLILPAAVILTMLLILGPVLAFTGRGEKETIWAETWLATLPILLAFPIGMGFGKPDFWSLDLKLSPFLATRPITAGQLVAAKMKSAACTTLLAWSILLATSIACIDLFCDTEHWGDWWSALAILYSPLSRWMVPILALVAGVLITWSLLVSSIWLGYSGRAGLYYTLTSIGLAAFVSGFIFLVWWLDHPQSRGDTLVGLLRWLPWALAALVTVKTWCAAIWAQEVYKRGLVSNRSVVIYSLVWLLATSCLLVLAWLMAPGIEWFRNLMLLAALCAIPSTAIAISPLAITWNRHR